MTKTAKSKTDQWPADRVERRSVETLIPYARNARTHSDEQIAQLAASIREWGWTTPVLVDESGTIIAGHGRVLAARKLGLESVPVMIARGWSEAQKRAYVLADNQLAQNAGWDDELLRIELEDLKGLEFNVELIGFSQAEFDRLINPPTDGELLDIGSIDRTDFEQDFLRFGDKKIPITDHELEALNAAYERHMDIHGIAFGFASQLLKGG